MNIQNFTDLELHQSAIQTAEKERAVTLIMLKHLNEIERRRLYSKYSASSLHTYCVKYLKMSDPQAGRRVAASRLLSDLPVIEEKILLGSMSLTSVSQAAVFFKKEAQSGNPFAKAEKLEVIQELETKATREVERILISKSANPSTHLKESVKPKTAELTEVKLHLDQETMKDIERLREIWSHAMPGATLAHIIKRTAHECCEKHDPLKKAERAEKRGQIAKEGLAENESQAEKKGRSEKTNGLAKDSAQTLRPEAESQNQKANEPTPAPERKSWVRHQVRIRDQDQCTFVDSRTNERCSSRHFLEEDHIIPKAMGGDYTVENIRLRCRAHNQRHAIETYRQEKMQRYLDRTAN